MPTGYGSSAADFGPDAAELSITLGHSPGNDYFQDAEPIL
jgi:hypothetical protein